MGNAPHSGSGMVPVPPPPIIHECAVRFAAVQVPGHQPAENQQDGASEAEAPARIRRTAFPEHGTDLKSPCRTGAPDEPILRVAGFRLLIDFRGGARRRAWDKKAWLFYPRPRHHSAQHARPQPGSRADPEPGNARPREAVRVLPLGRSDVRPKGARLRNPSRAGPPAGCPCTCRTPGIPASTA